MNDNIDLSYIIAIGSIISYHFYNYSLLTKILFSK